MMRNWRKASRSYGWLLAPALLAVAVQGLLVSRMTDGLLFEALRRELFFELELIEPAVQPLRDRAALQLRLDLLAARSSSRFEVWTGRGDLWAAAGHAAGRASAEESALRRDLEEARIRGRGSSVDRTDETPWIWVTSLVRGEHGEPFLFRVGRPIDAFRTLERALRSIFLLGLVVAATTALLASQAVDRLYFRPVRRLIRVAESFGRGQFDSPVPATGEMGVAGPLSRSLRAISSEVQARVRLLTEERNAIRAVLDSLQDGVLLLDAAGRVRLANESFRKIFELELDSATGGLLELVRTPELHRVLDEARAGNRAVQSRIELPHRGGVHLELRCTPLAAGSGLVLTVRDVTAEERTVEIRRDFVANVSHELRTPVAALRGWAETLADSTDTVEDLETVRSSARRIVSQAQRLELLLADLLTLSRLEQGLAESGFEQVDLRELARDAADLLAQSAAQRGVLVTVDPGPPVIVRGHRDALFRLVTNLLENAVKYNRDGGSAGISFPIASPREVILEVRDTGIGIAPRELPRIFERFYRVDKGRSRAEGGTGLGLAIVKHVAHSHGGRIEVESTPGSGSIFRVYLPLPRPGESSSGD